MQSFREKPVHGIAGKRFYLPALPFSLHFIRAQGSFVLVAFSFVCFFVAGQRNRQLNYFDETYMLYDYN